MLKNATNIKLKLKLKIFPLANKAQENRLAVYMVISDSDIKSLRNSKSKQAQSFPFMKYHKQKRPLFWPFIIACYFMTVCVSTSAHMVTPYSSRTINNAILITEHTK